MRGLSESEAAGCDGNSLCIVCGHPEKGNGAFRSRGWRGLEPGSRLLAGWGWQGPCNQGGLGSGSAQALGGRWEVRSCQAARPGYAMVYPWILTDR